MDTGQPRPSGTSCPTSTSQGAQALPTNGVLYVDQRPDRGGRRPTRSTPQQRGLPGAEHCSNCYYGQTGTPGNEGDAFVNGHALRPPDHRGQQQRHHRRPHQATTLLADTGRARRPRASAPTRTPRPGPTTRWASSPTTTSRSTGRSTTRAQRNTLAARRCRTATATTWVPPLCDPATDHRQPTGAPGPHHRRHHPGPQRLVRGQQLRHHRGNEGQLNIYGSIQQNARGAGRHLRRISTGLPQVLPVGSPPHPLRPPLLPDPGHAVVDARLLGRELHRHLPGHAPGPDDPGPPPSPPGRRRHDGAQRRTACVSAS